MVMQVGGIGATTEILIDASRRLKVHWPGEQPSILRIVHEVGQRLNEAQAIMTLHTPECRSAVNRLNELAMEVRTREKELEQGCHQAIRIARMILARPEKTAPPRVEGDEEAFWGTASERAVFCSITAAVWQLRAIADPSHDQCIDHIMKSLMGMTGFPGAPGGPCVIVMKFSGLDPDDDEDDEDENYEPESKHG